MSDVELDPLKTTIDLYIEAQTRIKEWEDIAKKCRSAIEARLGENEVGTIDDKPVVRWTRIESLRVDSTLLKGQYPDVYRACLTPSTSRRFTLVD
jgi:predicted phage-related endonuclease